MPFKNISILFVLIWFINTASKGQAMPPKERICGKWESVEKNLRIQIYMQDDKFIARLIWFSDTDGKPMTYWTDRHNPDPALRNRKIWGMNILRNLTYNPKTNSWEDGMVYDSRHGREWNASAYIDREGLLRVRGYWHFKFIGRTMTFRRLPD